MDLTALFNLTYGLYVIGAMDGNRPVGCIINTCFQVTSQNPMLAISLNKNNYTYSVIERSKKFTLSIVNEDTDTEIISTFGFKCSKDVDKYTQFGYEMFNNTPIVNGKFSSRLYLEVENMIDCGTHMVILARLIDTIKGEGTPMTYSYYHRVVKGGAPKNAPTYVAPSECAKETVNEGKKRFVCDVCGYILEADSVPEDYTCPVCHVDRTHFKQM